MTLVKNDQTNQLAGQKMFDFISKNYASANIQ
jgi:hypothetical protein